MRLRNKDSTNRRSGCKSGNGAQVHVMSGIWNGAEFSKTQLCNSGELESEGFRLSRRRDFPRFPQPGSKTMWKALDLCAEGGHDHAGQRIAEMRRSTGGARRRDIGASLSRRTC